MTDLLTQYTEATQQHADALWQASVQLAHRRLALRAMRNDGMTVLEISRLVKLNAGTVTRMIAKVDREVAEELREAEEIEREYQAAQG